MSAFCAHITDVQEVNVSKHVFYREVPILGIGRKHAGLDRQNGCGANKRLRGKRRNLPVIWISKVQSRPWELECFCPWECADSGLERASGAVGIAVVEDAVASAKGGSASSKGIPSPADSRHKLVIVNGGNARGNTPIARE